MSDPLAAASVWRLRCGIVADTALLWLARRRGSLITDALRTARAEKYRFLALHYRLTGRTEGASELERRAQGHLRAGEEDEGSLVGVLSGAGPKQRPPLAAARRLPDRPLFVDATGQQGTSNRSGK